MAAVCRRHHLRHGRFYNFGLLFVERDMATPAKIIGCAKLNQKAMVAPDNLPGIDRGKSSGHSKVGVARAGKTQEPNAEFLTALRNLRYKGCGCQEKYRPMWRDVWGACLLLWFV